MDSIDVEALAALLSGTDLLHADDDFHGPEVAPAISVSTTFRHKEVPQSEADVRFLFSSPELTRTTKDHVYSRISQGTSTRVETILSKITGGCAITYSSGLAAAFAALVFLEPKKIAITGGYHGAHHVISTYKRGRTLEVVDLDDDFTGVDLAWVETPLNPTGEARNLQHYADKVIHAVGGRLLVDATFGPPPLQSPFKWGTDIILHSGTKYLGGHSDLLAGVLVVKTDEEWGKLWFDRIALGNVLGSLEAWLLLRSLRTLHLRVPRQSATATALADWLNKIANTPKGESFDGVAGGIVTKVWHSSLQGKDASGWSPEQQMEGGHSPTFAMLLDNAEAAGALPHLLKYFIPATSLGGVESLIEQRRRSSPNDDPRLLRISVGVEELVDMKADFRQAFKALEVIVHHSRYERHSRLTGK
ncbi:cystathionine gamma-synthase [Artomyces pyxidatus]|uniref:Cystathionine gamma-synthase n=1 Tax=Artomyces pyxidatus TaxID=48021 RepID=A0ACB8TL68_9AGAM|nr:cystathionine gamma-synthase [Artomyces pyxidatus]